MKNNYFAAIVGAGMLSFLLTGCGSSPTKDTASTPIETQTYSTPTTDTPLSSDQKSRLNSAIDMINNEEFKTAHKVLKGLYKKSPSNRDVAANYALSAYKTNNKKLARSILAKDQRSPLAQNLLGMLALESDRPKAADEHFQKAIALDGEYAQAYYNLALVYDTYYQDLSSAIKLYQTYLVLIDFKDIETQKWVKELESSASRGN